MRKVGGVDMEGLQWAEQRSRRWNVGGAIQRSGDDLVINRNRVFSASCTAAVMLLLRERSCLVHPMSFFIASSFVQRNLAGLR